MIFFFPKRNDHVMLGRSCSRRASQEWLERTGPRVSGWIQVGNWGAGKVGGWAGARGVWGRKEREERQKMNLSGGIVRLWRSST